MNDRQFLHDWEPHYWRSAVTQQLKGYKSCRDCGRVEWLSGDIQESDKMTEEECHEQLFGTVMRPLYIQDPLLEWNGP